MKALIWQILAIREFYGHMSDKKLITLVRKTEIGSVYLETQIRDVVDRLKTNKALK